MVSTRWLDWRPRDRNPATFNETEPAKPSECTSEGFDGPVPVKNCPNSPSEPNLDPTLWRDDFDQWRQERCIHRVGKDDWGGIADLHIDFAEWCFLRDCVSCTRTTFEWLLLDGDFPINDGLVKGLVLKRTVVELGYSHLLSL